MITDVHHTALFVTDLDRSLPFYVDKLGFELVSRSDDWGGQFMDDVCGGVENLRINVALLRAGGEIVELIQVLSPDTLPTDATERRVGIARIGFEVDDIEATVAELSRRGVEFMSDIVTVTVKPDQHYSDGKAIKFQDPDGIILELQQPPAPGRVT
ncbi:MAG: VOC family protein [Gaiellaceae bacterium]